MPIERKLAAIMFTDIAGYTEQMSKSESKSLVLLEKKRSILKPLIKELNGTFVKEIGDGTLSYFESAVNASTCAVKLQEQTYNDEDLNIRAGIHIGDIVFKDDDVFGDGVNIASRLESIAPQGGVCVSKNVYDELLNQDGFDGVELGLQSLKGVGRLIEVFGLIGERLKEPNPEEYKENEVKVHSDDEVPSIAIIPFDNKGAEEDVFYAYGISADLISDVSGAGLIRVAGLKDIEKLDYANLKYEELSEKLLVRYIAQGTLWKMGEMFQLSIELYDTKDKKVVWSDRWQEKWENLPNIKVNLSDGLLKSLDTKPEADQKAETSNPEAYSFYLEAKQKYEKRENTDDTEIVRGLLNKAIKLDGNLIDAKLLLGDTYMNIVDHEKAMEIYNTALKQSEEMGDKLWIGRSTRKVGNVHGYKRDYDTALDYWGKSLAMAEELGDKAGMGSNLGNIGIMHSRIGDYDKALEYYERTRTLFEVLEDKSMISSLLTMIGNAHVDKGDWELALDDYGRALLMNKELGEKFRIGFSLFEIGLVYYIMGDYDRALENLEKSLAIQKEIGFKEIELETTTNLYITYKHLGKNYDVNEIHSLIKEADNLKFEFDCAFYTLYELLEEKSYLETVYNQVQDKADAMDDELKEKYLNYPIQKQIVEEWEKIK